MTFPDTFARERAIIETGTSFVVTAGAGTGKTSLLVERALYLLLSGRVYPERLAAITFTEKAAAELKRRIAQGLTDALAALDASSTPQNGEAVRSLERLRRSGETDESLGRRAREALETLDMAFIGTLHALAADILRRHAMAASLPPDFAVEDELSGGLLFDEAWSRFLSEELGQHGTRAQLWSRVLRRFREADIERAARCLHADPAAADLLAAEGYRPLIPESELDLQVRTLSGRIAEHRAHLQGPGAPKLRNSNFPNLLETEQHFLETYLKGGASALAQVDVLRLPVPDFWERAKKKKPFSAGTGARSEEMEQTAKTAMNLLDKLVRVDEDAIRDLMEILRPFAESLREHVRREGVLTFDDLLILARDLLRDDASVRSEERLRFQAVLVDEFQDTDPIQYEIIFFLCSEGASQERDPYTLALDPGRLFIVGDPKQSIYRFRGADMSAYDRAVRHVLRRGQSLSLVTSYRSRPEVLDPLNILFREWIGANPDRAIDPEYEDLSPSRAPGGAHPGVELWSVMTEHRAPADLRRRTEALEIANRIREWLDTGTHRAKDVAIIFRALPDAPIYIRALREARIDFVMEGGRAFFERPEIVEAFALLGAIANPADAVSLLGVLRSGFGGATDQELVAYQRAGGVWRWKGADAGIDTVRATFARLGALEASRHAMPLDRWIQWVLVESPFALTQVAHLDGPQRVANLRKLAQKAGTLVRERGLTLDESLRVLSDAFAGERVEGESPLADEALDAVRLTTIHKAKGLEYPIVIIPDLARGIPAPPTETRVKRFTQGEGSYLAVEISDRERTRNLSEVARFDAYRSHDLAEAARLLYVATTRARDRVILVNSATKSGVAWMNGLARIGYTLADDAFPEEGRLGESGIMHRVCVPQAIPASIPSERSSPALRAYRAFEAAATRAQETRAPRFRNPSLDHLLAATDKDENEDPGLQLYAPDLARAVGVAVHRILEQWNFAHTGDWATQLESVVARTARELGISRVAELEREASRVLGAFATSPLAAYLGHVDILGREVPILWRDPAGSTVIGYADLIYRKDGRVHVADYKTDADTSADQAVRYRAQLTDYARAVEEALALSERPVMEILFLRSGTRVPL